MRNTSNISKISNIPSENEIEKRWKRVVISLEMAEAVYKVMPTALARSGKNMQNAVTDLLESLRAYEDYRKESR